MSKGMQKASQVLCLTYTFLLLVSSDFSKFLCQNLFQALLSGCSAGGLAAIIHCDEFRDLFPKTTKVKCLSDAGLFLDA